MTHKFRCPECRAEFEVTEAVAQQLRDGIRREFQVEVERREAVAEEREQALARRERAVDAAVEKKLAAERTALLQQANEKSREGVALELKSLADQLCATRTKLYEAQATELQLRKERTELDDQRRELALTVQRTIDAELPKIQERVRREADEEYRLKEAENEKQLADMRRKIDELNRKAAAVPAHTTGEVLEQDIEQILRAQFPQDRFEAVPDSHRGADILQYVRDPLGRECGAILWEVKRTKQWQAAWLAKLREDQRLAKARLAVIVSQELPRDVADFGCIEGIHVTRRLCTVPLAVLLRTALVEIAKAEQAQHNRHGKAEQLLAYVTGHDFRLRFGGLIEALTAMQADLEKEKRSIQTSWTKRTRQIAMAVSSVAGFQGEVAAILGAALPDAEPLEPIGVTDASSDAA
jgi:hypothetical protein